MYRLHCESPCNRQCAVTNNKTNMSRRFVFDVETDKDNVEFLEM